MRRRPSMTWVDPTAHIGTRVTIGPHVFIGPKVVVYDDCTIGPGAVIGSHGFGYLKDSAGRWTMKPHGFGVILQQDVHVGANTCIDRGSWRDTLVMRGARIDNLVHVAHNVQIGENAIVVAQAELSGSVVVGDEAWIGPRACIKERVLVGYRALVGMGAVVIHDVQTNTTVAGNPARVINDQVGVRETM